MLLAPFYCPGDEVVGSEHSHVAMEEDRRRGALGSITDRRLEIGTLLTMVCIARLISKVLAEERDRLFRTTPDHCRPLCRRSVWRRHPLLAPFCAGLFEGVQTRS